MKYIVEETQTRIQAHSGNQEVEIPDGCIPLMAARGIGVFQVLYLRPIGEVPAPIEETPAPPIEQVVVEEPEVYVSKKDRKAKAKKAEGDNADEEA